MGPSWLLLHGTLESSSGTPIQVCSMTLNSCPSSEANVKFEKTGEELRALCHQYPPPRPIFASGANGSWVRGVAYARSGCQTATIADDGLIRFWNLLEPEADPSAIAIGDEEMVCCTFSPSGRVFAVG